MPTVDPDDPRLQQRPLVGMLILLLPLVLLAITVVGYAAMFGLGIRGRPAEGPTVPLAFAGCPEAGPVLGARLADMGIAAEPADDGLTFVVQLPADPEVAAELPATLATPGRLEVRTADGAVLATAADVVDASVRMDLLMTPTTLVHLHDEAAARVRDHVRAAPEGRLTFVLDGATIGSQSNQARTEVGEVEIDPTGLHDGRLDEGKARWAAVAAWSVIVDHPLPCDVRPR